jgi:anthranilate synthase component II
MILLIDNYDSFTYNLYQYLGEVEKEIVVKRNDEITLAEIEELNPMAIVISPGPGRPEDAGISMEIIRNFYEKVPLLGICLGHQAIGAVFGANVVGAK